MNINEDKAIGIRKPRGLVTYPYSNKDGAQGFSKYMPLKDLYPKLFSSEELENNAELQISLNEVNDELIAYLVQHPEFIRSLNPRKFEELIAEIFRNKGYEVTLTPQTRDGGKDIIAVYNSPFGHQMFIVECKKYKEDHKVGVELVRGLYGVKSAERYTQAILVTTSSFTEDAKKFVKPLEYELALKDFEDIKKWCMDYSK
ncbi:restriction endonuclease [Pedobacter frigidisoli]|nr:restriction endonuclease [Pedobacter frigidisoli]